MRLLRTENELKHLRGLNITDMQESFASNGFVILRDMIPDEAIQKYKHHYEATSHKWRYTEEERKINYFEFPNDIHTKDHVVEWFLNQIALTEMAAMLLKCKSRPRLTLSIIPWTSIGQKWHRDRAQSEMFGKYDDRKYVQQIGAWVALDEITEYSGPFGFIPGSHLLNYGEDKYYLEKKNAFEMSLIDSGDAIVMGDGSITFTLAVIENSTFGSQISNLYSTFFASYVYDAISDGLFWPEIFTAKAGDVLFWDDQLIHCAHPSHPGHFRKSVIGHYYK